MDADLCVWNPDDDLTVLKLPINIFHFHAFDCVFKKVTEDVLQFRHKLSPYLGQTLRGRVKVTVLRGQVIYSDGSFFRESRGILLIDPL